MITSAELEQIVRQHLEGKIGGTNGAFIQERKNDRGGLLRATTPSGESVIVKIWRPRNLYERVKSLLRLSDGRQEWDIHAGVYSAGLRTPKPIAYCNLRLPEGDRVEAMAIEDLGETKRGLAHLKGLIAAGDEAAVTRCEDELIAMTRELLGLGLVDVDHQLNNFLVDSEGSLFRVDFECARRSGWRANRKGLFAETLARLLASHVYAVQPDTERTVSFTQRLYDELDVAPPTRAEISRRVQAKLDEQRANRGVHSRVSLPQ